MMPPCPLKPGMDAGERTRVVRHRIANHRQSKVGQPLRVVVGIDYEPAKLSCSAAAWLT